MPNRILREGIICSDRIDGLPSWAAEVFYRRLMSVVDDYGRFDGRLSVIRSRCYSLRLDTVGDSDIGKWLDECSNAALVRRYTVDNKPYVVMLDFNQQVRSASKYPPPPKICGTAAKQVHSIHVSNDHLGGVGDEGEDGDALGVGRAGVRVDNGSWERAEGPPAPPPDSLASFDAFWSAYPKQVKRPDAERAFIDSGAFMCVDVVIAAVESQARSQDWKREKGRYIPDPSNWLRKKQWEDTTPEMRQRNRELAKIAKI